MKKAESMNWFEINQRCLVEALAEVREIFRERSRSGKEARPVIEMGERERETRPAENPAMTPAPPALETLCSLFGLSVFERRVLLLCAGMDLDSAFPAMVAEAHGDPRRAAPTFSLALSAFPDAHWSAFSPGRPLRYWRFIELEPGESLTRRGLCIDERILHYLTGVHHPDERLAGCVTPVEAAGELTSSQRAAADRLVAGWSNLKSGERLPVVNLSGGDPAGRRDIAAAACQRLGVDLLAMSARSIPLEPRELEALTRLWEREAVLGNCALLLDCENLDPSDAARAGAVDDLIEGARAALIVTGARRPLDIRRPSLPLTAPSPTTGERILVWQNTLGPAVHRIDGGPDSLAAQFSLSPSNIRAACLEGLVKANGGRASRSNPRGDGLADALWSACRKRTRPRLSDLARRIEPAAAWEDLVLPENQRRILREIGIHVRHRAMVHETWGFAAKCGRGLGISSLFVGPSGTGKTMAAEVLANELRLDLYRVDLSQVVSKYIGETEKNLRRVFDAAEDGGAILLFDEADALFGKRGEVKDSHDRYANIEISYLLQRMETYRGLAILTSNMKSALDNAFLRRIRFVARFPFPDAEQRAEIWRRVFPVETPSKGLDVHRLAGLNVTGGNIRNMAIYAAFLAADAGEPVGMSHLFRAAKVEFAKLEKPMPHIETGAYT